MSKLTKRQSDILSFIKQEVREKGYPPSVREIGEAVGLASSSTVHGHLSRLEAKGFIRRDPTKPRAIEVMGFENKELTPSLHKKIPIVGKVTAGTPITAIENIDDFLLYPLNNQQFINDTLFALAVQGDSMIDAGILDGDYVIVRQQQDASNGEIVVAMTEEDEATVKRFYNEGTHIRLQPENQTLHPLLVPNVTVLGKVVGLYRTIQ